MAGNTSTPGAQVTARLFAVLDSFDPAHREQRLTEIARRAGLPWSLSKGMDTFAPLSRPVPTSEAPDLHSLNLELRVNDEVRQKGNTSNMIFGPERLIAYISKYMTLEPGDIVSTGTPEGVGPMQPGDEVEVSIAGLGALTNTVARR